MQKPFEKALDEVKDLYQSFLGQPAPEITPESFVSFPHGVDPLQHAMLEVQHVRQLREQIRSAPQPVAWVPQADCFASNDMFLALIEIPGIKKEDVKVFVADGECVVRGERKAPDDEPHLQPLNVERPWGAFERRFTLPVGSRTEEITAVHVDGILKLRVPVEAPKAAERKTVEVG